VEAERLKITISIIFTFPALCYCPCKDIISHLVLMLPSSFSYFGSIAVPLIVMVTDGFGYLIT